MEESELVFLLDDEEEEEVMTVSYSREKHQLPASLCSQITPGGLVVEVGAHETMPLRNKPLLSLVKSLSTEISRREPEVSQSRSDSKLNLHLWRQLTQPRGGVTELSSAPSSPSSPCPSSPSEPKAGFFKAELEDTRRKFSEAIQEPLSMLSKIMREEEPDDSDSVKNATPPCDTPSCKLQNPPPGACGERRCYDVCTHGDVMQAVQDKAHHVPDYPAGHAPVPCKRLFGVAALAYGFFVLPLPTYVSGLSLGVACGFVIGLLVVLLLAHRCPVRALRKTSPVSHKGKLELTSRKPRDSKDLEGWMNEASTYDPETHHPLLLHSVYASLEGSVLQLAYPGSNVPRRAAFGEIPPEATFHRSHCFQVAGSKVFLSPPALARKRIWNKKYPICIRLVSQKEGGARTPTEEELISPVTLYLFGRTGREKEEWFQYFLSASKVKGQESHEQSALHGSSSPGHAQCSSDPCRGSSEDLPSLLRRDIPGSVREKILLDYSSYMARFVTSESRPHESHPPSPTHSSADSPALKSKSPQLTSEPVTSDHTAWVNALLGRIFWDFLREKYWCDQVAHKIQKKLSRIRLPYFMNELTLTELDMGSGLPQVMNISQPSVDNKGLWLDLDLVYTGALQMTLETKMNLCKLGKEGGTEADCTLEMQSVSSKPKLCILGESDEESSSAGSSDEEELPPSELQGTLGDKTTPPGADGHGGGRTGRKILRFVDKIAKSKYFQKATENEYIRKKIVEVSNTPLLLTVEVRELSGGLAINIPPPPTDRIWYSFRVPPRLDLRVRPMLGEREVTFTHVTEWIEKKLQREFQKVFVMPNMDDLYLPFMHSNLDNPPASHTATGCNLHHSSEEVEKQKETSVIHKDYS